MAAFPEVFVRPVTMAEGQRLQRIGRTARDPVELRRAIVVLMSAQAAIAGYIRWHNTRAQPKRDFGEIPR